MSQVTSQNALVKDSTVQTLNGKLDNLNATLGGNANIAPVFNTATAYSKGDMVNYNGDLYVFTANHSAGAWTGSDAVQTKVSSELSSLKSGLTTKATFTSVGGTTENYRDVTIPSDNNAVFLIVAGGSITSVSTDSAGNVSDITFVSASQDSKKIDDHTVRIWGGAWYRSYSVLKFA